jgi:hypothetical protein
MQRSFRFVLVLLTLALAACGSTSTSRPKSIPQPDLDARITHDVFFGSMSSAPVTIAVSVRNRGTVPISVRKIELDSPGMAQWGVIRTTKYYNEVVAAGEEKPILVVATAVTNVSRPSEPLQLRAIVEFEAEGTRWREILMARQ